VPLIRRVSCSPSGRGDEICDNLRYEEDRLRICSLLLFIRPCFALFLPLFSTRFLSNPLIPLFIEAVQSSSPTSFLGWAFPQGLLQQEARRASAPLVLCLGGFLLRSNTSVRPRMWLIPLARADISPSHALASNLAGRSLTKEKDFAWNQSRIPDNPTRYLLQRLSSFLLDVLTAPFSVKRPDSSPPLSIRIGMIFENRWHIFSYIPKESEPTHLRPILVPISFIRPSSSKKNELSSPFSRAFVFFLPPT